jgi:hypothetical protein
MATGRVGFGWSVRGPAPETRTVNPPRTRNPIRVETLPRPRNPRVPETRRVPRNPAPSPLRLCPPRRQRRRTLLLTGGRTSSPRPPSSQVPGVATPTGGPQASRTPTSLLPSHQWSSKLARRERPAARGCTGLAAIAVATAEEGRPCGVALAWPSGRSDRVGAGLAWTPSPLGRAGRAGLRWPLGGPSRVGARRPDCCRRRRRELGKGAGLAAAAAATGNRG